MILKDYNDNTSLRIDGDKCYDAAGRWVFIKRGNYLYDSLNNWHFVIKGDRVYDIRGNWVYTVHQTIQQNSYANEPVHTHIQYKNVSQPTHPQPQNGVVPHAIATTPHKHSVVSKSKKWIVSKYEEKPVFMIIAAIAIIVLLIILVFQLSSCGSSPRSVSLIIGEWRCECCRYETWTFNTDGRYRIREDGHSESGTFHVLNDGTLDMIDRWGDNWGTWTWANNPNNLTYDEWHVTQNNLYVDGTVFRRR